MEDLREKKDIKSSFRMYLLFSLVAFYYQWVSKVDIFLVLTSPQQFHILHFNYNFHFLELQEYATSFAHILLHPQNALTNLCP